MRNEFLIGLFLPMHIDIPAFFAVIAVLRVKGGKIVGVGSSAVRLINECFSGSLFKK